MINATKLLEEHERDFGGRPQRIQRVREAISAYCDLTVPRSVSDVPEWYESHKAVITRRLREVTGYYDDEGGDE
jgi:hypothetical protein